MEPDGGRSGQEECDRDQEEEDEASVHSVQEDPQPEVNKLHELSNMSSEVDLQNGYIRDNSKAEVKILNDLSPEVENEQISNANVEQRSQNDTTQMYT